MIFIVFVVQGFFATQFFQLDDKHIVYHVFQIIFSFPFKRFIKNEPESKINITVVYQFFRVTCIMSFNQGFIKIGSMSKFDMDKVYRLVIGCIIGTVLTGCFSDIFQNNFKVCTCITYPTIIPEYAVPTSNFYSLVHEVCIKDTVLDTAPTVPTVPIPHRADSPCLRDIFGV